MGPPKLHLFKLPPRNSNAAANATSELAIVPAIPYTDFHKFTQLPTELQTEIWKQCLPSPRIVKLTPYRYYTSPHYSETGFPAFEPSRNAYRHQFAGLYNACKASRYIVEKEISAVFVEADSKVGKQPAKHASRQQIVLNPALDILDCRNCFSLAWWVDSPSFFRGVSTLLVDWEEIIGHNFPADLQRRSRKVIKHLTGFRAMSTILMDYSSLACAAASSNVSKSLVIIEENTPMWCFFESSAEERIGFERHRALVEKARASFQSYAASRALLYQIPVFKIACWVPTTWVMKPWEVFGGKLI